jgi:hypothetical protein
MWLSSRQLMCILSLISVLRVLCSIHHTGCSTHCRRTTRLAGRLCCPMDSAWELQSSHSSESYELVLMNQRF